MYRVELKVSICFRSSLFRCLFLMYRVELKGFTLSPFSLFKSSFLMYRVELKGWFKSLMLRSIKSS